MKQMRVGVIGARGRVAILKRWMQNPRVTLVAVADIEKESLEWFRDHITSDVDFVMDHRMVAARPDIDAVIVMTPDFVHEEHATHALMAGKHVYLEKPMTISIEGCDRLIHLAKSAGRTLMVGHNMRFMDNFRAMKKVIDQGEIGDIKAVWVRHFVGRGGPYYFHDWHGNRVNTGTLLLQKGSHDIDIIHWLTGAYTKRVAAFGDRSFYGGDRPNDLRCRDCSEASSCSEMVTSHRDLCAFREDIDVEDNEVLIMELERGIKASYTQCQFTPDYHRNFTVIGTKGRVENSELESKVHVKRRRSDKSGLVSDMMIQTFEPLGHEEADQKILNEFVEVVLDGKTPSISPLAARMSVAVGVAAAQSIRNGGLVVEIPTVSRDG